MSTDSNTKKPVDWDDTSSASPMSEIEAARDEISSASRRVEIHASAELANKVLALFEVPMPPAHDLTEIRIIIRD